LPVQVQGLSDVSAIFTGYFHSFALKSDGTVWAWGWNSFGQLGDNTKTDRLARVQVSSLNLIVPTTTPTTTPTETPTITSTATPTSTPANTPTTSPPTEKDNNNNWLWILLCLVIVISIGVTVLIILRFKKQANNNNQTLTTIQLPQTAI